MNTHSPQECCSWRKPSWNQRQRQLLGGFQKGDETSCSHISAHAPNCLFLPPAPGRMVPTVHHPRLQTQETKTEKNSGYWLHWLLVTLVTAGKLLFCSSGTSSISVRWSHQTFCSGWVQLVCSAAATRLKLRIVPDMHLNSHKDNNQTYVCLRGISRKICAL